MLKLKLYSNKNNHNINGFTIIELLTVLFVGAILSTLGFLVIEIAQRSARNSERQTDINTLNRALGNYLANNNAVFPASIFVSSSTNKAKFCNAPAPLSMNSCYGDGNNEFDLKVYSSTESSIILQTNSGTRDYAAIKDPNIIKITFAAKCSSDFSTSDQRTSSRRSISIQYAYETAGSSGSSKCDNLYDQ